MPDPQRILYEFGCFRVDPSRRLLLREGLPVPLQPKAFDALLVLIQHDDRVVSKSDLLTSVWPDAFVEESNLSQTIFVLRKALGDSAEEPRYIVTVPARGYRFAADVRRLEQGDPSAHVGLKRSDADASLSSTARRIMLAVLPLRNLTGDDDQEYFSDGLTEELITQLGRLDPERLGVIGRTSVMAYKGMDKSLDRIGRRLGVQYLVEGSVRRDRTRLRVTVQLIQVKDQSLIWSEGYDQSGSAALTVQDEVAGAVASAIGVRLIPGRRVGDALARVTSGAAYEAYLKGSFFLNQRTPDGVRRAIEYFDEAVTKEPTNARLHAGLAYAWSVVAYYGMAPPNDALPNAKAAALRAIAIDDRLGAAHASLGLISIQYDRDWAASRWHFTRAVQLDPNDPLSHQSYAAVYFAVRGEFDEAIAELRLALELDPLSPSIKTALAASLCWAGRWDEGLEQFRNAFELAPNYPLARWWLSQLYAFSGRHAEAMAEVEKIETASTLPFAAAQRGYVCALLGRRSEALRIAEELQQLSARTYVDPAFTADIHAGLGDSDATFLWLERAYEQRSLGMLRLNQSPAYDRFRSDPRFVGLLARFVAPDASIPPGRLPGD